MPHESTAPRPARLEAATTSRRHERLGVALAIISAAQLMIVLDTSVVNIALPSVQADLGFSVANLPWVVNAYVVAFGGLLLLGGRAGDLLGRRRVFMAGIALFTLASLLGGLARTEAWLLAARALQGVSAALVAPTALALISTTFPAGPRRNRAFAVYAGMSGMGAAMGLIIGGALTEVSWRWTLFINIPIGVLMLLLTPRFLPEASRLRGRFDLGGALLGTGGLVAMVYGLTHAATRSWTSPTTVALLLGGAALLGVFLVVESRVDHPLLPMHILSDRARAVSFAAMLIMGGCIISTFFFISLYVQQVMRYEPLEAGLAYLPFAIGMIVSAQVASALLSRVDPRWISGAGNLIIAAAMWGNAQLEVGSSYLTGLLPWIVLSSVGVGFAYVPLTITALSRIRERDSGIGAGALNTTQQFGGALGLAALGTLAAQAGTDKAHELMASAQAGAFDPSLIAPTAQTHGATFAFGVIAALQVVAAIILLVGLDIRHHELAADADADG